MKYLKWIVLLVVCLWAVPSTAAVTATATASRAADGSGDICYAPCAVHWDAHTTTADGFSGDDLLFALDYTCDDGGTTPGDGCSATCTIESDRFMRNKRNMRPVMGNSGSGAHNY